jgi:hypothetical protein
MEGIYQVTFSDGSVERVTAAGRSEAKEKIRAVRLNQVDPAQKMDANDRMKHARVKIVDVKEVTQQPVDGQFAVTMGDGSTEHVAADHPALASSNAALQRRLDSQARDAHPSAKAIHVAPVVKEVLVTLAIGLGFMLLYQLDALTAARFGHTSHADVMQLVGASGTAISATISALTAVTGDSLQIPSCPEGKAAMILQFWTDVQVAGTARIRSGKFHDNTNGIRKDTIISELNPAMPFGFGQRIYPGDLLTVELAGSAVAGDIEYLVMLQWFESLSAQQATFMAPDVLLPKILNYSYVENTIATGATAAWAGSEAINAETDQFHAGRMYALVGYCVDTEVPAIAWRGPDTANLRVGGPGLDQDQIISNDWFVRLSRAFNKPLIPVIQANNKAATMIDTLQDENGADTTVISIYAEIAA